jgi:hypothetical protein
MIKSSEELSITRTFYIPHMIFRLVIGFTFWLVMDPSFVDPSFPLERALNPLRVLLEVWVSCTVA